ncbi:MAG: hypothetical protein Kow00120_07080 [Anaerolineae bacterium]
MADQTQPTKAEHLETLYQITRTINSSLDLDVVLEEVIDRVIEVTHAERGFLLLRNDDGVMEFRVARGLNQEDLKEPEFQVSQTILREVATSQTPLLTSNAQYDERFRAGHSIVAMKLLSILCVPIMVKDRLIGLVYVDNRLQSGVFNADDRDLLAAFASQAGVAIENARLYRVAVEKGRMERELQMAHDIQRGLLPDRIPHAPGYELAADWRAAREVAGDFYDFIALEDGRLGVVIADVSDKGVPAALFMAVARSVIRSSALLSATPDETLRHANDLMLRDAQSGMFVTAYYAILEPGGLVQCVNAGHNRPLLYHTATDTEEYLPRGGRAMGWFDDLPVKTEAVQMAPGDVLVLYTDGVTEAEDRLGACFGNARLAEAVRAAHGQTAAAVLNQINAMVDAFVGGAPPFDDHTLVVIRYVGG